MGEGSRIAQAIDYSLNHWQALTRHLEDGAVPIDNNLIERQIKPWKLGAKNWLFIGSELAGRRAAVVMSLVQSALCRARHKAESLLPGGRGAKLMANETAPPRVR